MGANNLFCIAIGIQYSPIVFSHVQNPKQILSRKKKSWGMGCWILLFISETSVCGTPLGLLNECVKESKRKSIPIAAWPF